MAPVPDLDDRFDYIGRQKARKSAVLLLLYPHNGAIEFPLIVRQEYPGVHSGQIALPGGKFEDSDQNLTETALRETHEEIGIPPDQIKVLGHLSELFVPPSNFNILPVVGFTTTLPKFIPQQEEVRDIIKADINDLNDEHLRKHKNMTFFNKAAVSVPYFDIQGHVVWGATAMILSEFAKLTKTFNNKNEQK